MNPTAVVAGLAILLAPTIGTGAIATGDCPKVIAEAEKSLHIPPGLLLAIGMVEAGHNGTVWPWTLNLNGRSRYFDSRREAWTALNLWLANGGRKADVGCLQLNIDYVGKGISTSQLLNPKTNATVAARRLILLRKKTGNWTDAVKLYHSARPSINRPYACRVYNQMLKINGIRQPRCKSGKVSNTLSP